MLGRRSRGLPLVLSRGLNGPARLRCCRGVGGGGRGGRGGFSLPLFLFGRGVVKGAWMVVGGELGWVDGCSLWFSRERCMWFGCWDVC